jgi:hypothetical protein
LLLSRLIAHDFDCAMLIADARGHRFHRYFESINDEAGVEAGDRAGSYTPLHRFGWPTKEAADIIINAGTGGVRDWNFVPDCDFRFPIVNPGTAVSDST